MEQIKKTHALVAEFHHAFSQPVLFEPEIPTVDRCNLRIALLREELEELITAIDKKDTVEIADALVDLQYVLSGTVLEFGLQEKFELPSNGFYGRVVPTVICTILSDEIDSLARYIEFKNIEGIESVIYEFQYVLLLALYSYGLSKKFMPLFEEVHRSNMSKACKDVEEAEQTIEWYKGFGTDCYIHPVSTNGCNEVFHVLRDSDRKLLKSIHYSPADLKSIINAEQVHQKQA
jgi:predicted HAD superfamily Cof-like phosphohydrolase